MKKKNVIIMMFVIVIIISSLVLKQFNNNQEIHDEVSYLNSENIDSSIGCTDMAYDNMDCSITLLAKKTYLEISKLHPALISIKKYFAKDSSISIETANVNKVFAALVSKLFKNFVTDDYI